MATNDTRRITQIKTFDKESLNEAFRQLNNFITLLEGRQGQIQLRDGIHASSSSQTGIAIDSEVSNAASWGVYFAGTNFSDTWLASGAKLLPTNEWIALNTRAAFLKLSNASGPQFYFNTGLTIGTSFIPTLVPAPGSASIIWAAYDSVTLGSPIVWDTTLHEESGYFTLTGGGTTVELLVNGTYQIHASAALTVAAADGTTRLSLVLNGGLIRSSKIATETPDPINHHTLYHIDDYVAGDLISLTYDLGDLYTAESTGLNRLYITRLLSA
jgi:hypothetical protein